MTEQRAMTEQRVMGGHPGPAGTAAARVPAERPPDAGRFVPAAPRPELGRLLRIPVHLADRPLVAPGQPVVPGQPLVEHFREQELLEVESSPSLLTVPPGATLDNVPVEQVSRLGRRSTASSYRARVCEHGRDGVTRLVAGSAAVEVLSPAGGVIEAVTPGRVDLRAEGLALDALVGWGRPTVGQVVLAVDARDAEVQTSRIDVAMAGAVLVVGARVDIEALSRARALGVAAIISGGVASRDLRQLTSSEARQQAALHASAPFGILAFGGYGRAPIPGYVWDLLVAAQGRRAGLLPGSRTLIVDGDPEPLLRAAARPPDRVRVVAGELRDREGFLVGLSGPRLWPGGGYAAGGFVELDGLGGERERHCLPLVLLERLG
jgi:hypothetical protein